MIGAVIVAILAAVAALFVAAVIAALAVGALIVWGIVLLLERLGWLPFSTRRNGNSAS